MIFGCKRTMPSRCRRNIQRDSACAQRTGNPSADFRVASRQFMKLTCSIVSAASRIADLFTRTIMWAGFLVNMLQQVPTSRKQK